MRGKKKKRRREETIREKEGHVPPSYLQLWLQCLFSNSSTSISSNFQFRIEKKLAARDSPSRWAGTVKRTAEWAIESPDRRCPPRHLRLLRRTCFPPCRHATCSRLFPVLSRYLLYLYTALRGVESGCKLRCTVITKHKRGYNPMTAAVHDVYTHVVCTIRG